MASLVADLQALKVLHHSGDLDDDEFRAAKARAEGRARRLRRAAPQRPRPTERRHRGLVG